MVRFGYTVGRDGGIAKEGTVHNIWEAILNGEPVLPRNLSPLGIPDNVREVVISEHQKYDWLRELSEHWYSKPEEKVLSMKWETGSATLPGSEMLSLLITASQVGKLTAIT